MDKNIDNFAVTMRKLATFILLLLSCACSFADGFTPKREIRAVWLTTLGGLDWPSTYAMSKYSAQRQRAELTATLDKLHDAGINAVLFQVRTRSAVLYPSQYEPWAACVSGHLGKSPGYDVLKFAIDECHRRGMELHAWVTTIPAGKWDSDACRRLRKRLPGIVKRDGKEGFLDPAKRETAAYLANICGEIAENYDVDGIHLDYIRYPETYRMRLSPSEARRNVTDVVRKITLRVKSAKPWVKMSCSPVGKYSDLSRASSRGWNARDRVYQDAQAWLRDGLMDLLFPMMYFKNENYFPFLMDWSENRHEGNVAAGLAAYMLAPGQGNWQLEDIMREMYVARQFDTGYAFFRSRFFTDDVKGIYTFTKDIFNAYPALMPETHCHGVRMPEAPNELDVKYSGGYYILRWDSGMWFDESPYTAYNLYASDKYPVDTDDARNLIRCRTTKTEAAVARCQRPLYFAVTTTDRYGRESGATQQDAPFQTEYRSGMMVCGGSSIKIDDIAGDTEFIVAESLEGNMIATLPYSGGMAKTASLRPGMYVLRTLNSRGISHRIGVMLKK